MKCSFWKNAIEDLIKEQKHALLTEFAQNDERIEETKTIIIATRNPGKAEEFRNMFKEAGYHVKHYLTILNCQMWKKLAAHLKKMPD